MQVITTFTGYVFYGEQNKWKKKKNNTAHMKEKGVVLVLTVGLGNLN